jgi:hypothetical protein
MPCFACIQSMGRPLTDDSVSHTSPERKRWDSQPPGLIPRLAPRAFMGAFKSCEAVFDEPGIGGSSRSCFHAKHDILSFLLGRHPPAGAALRILRSSLGRSRGSAEARGAFGFFAPVGECAAAKRDGEKANATRLLPSPAAICHQRTLPHPHHSARFSKAKNRCQSGKTQGRIPREDRNFRLSGPDR